MAGPAPDAPQPAPGGIIDQARARLRRETIKLEGRVRDDIVNLFKTVPAGWHKMTEREQAKVIDRAGTLAEKLVEDLGTVMCARGFKPISIAIGGGKFDGEKIVCGFALPMSEDNLAAIGSHVGSPWLLIPVDLEDWQGADPMDPDVIGDLRLPREPAPTGEEIDAATGDAVEQAVAPVDGNGAAIEHDPVTGEELPAPSPPTPAGEQPAAH